ncbi:MAG TPA: anti-sigma factor [bacterium]
MKCSKIQKKLSNYLDNALPDNEKDVIADHLLTCATCQAEFSTLKKLHNTLGLLDDMPVPDEFSAKLIGKIKTLEKNREITMPFSVFGRTIMAAACVAVILLSILFGNHIGRTLYKETTGKRLPHNTRVIEIFETQASIELANYLNYRLNYDVQNGGAQ